MKISKANNRFYAQYIEEATTNFINGNVVGNNTGYNFKSEEIEEMDKHAQIIAQYLNGNKAIWKGSQTSSESCDILVDGKEIELKYVCGGSGTYYNTSMSYVESLGFISYNSFLKDYLYIDTLKEIFGDIIDENNISPVSNKNSKWIRNNYPEIYKELSSWEYNIRTIYVSLFFDFLVENPEARSKFIRDMISKESSGKHTPDELVIFNHNKETITSWIKKDLLSHSKSDIITLSGCSILFGKAKATFAWQNGTGLNNPTIRIFL